MSSLVRSSPLLPLSVCINDETTTTQDAIVMTPTDSTAVALSTDHGDSPHEYNAENDPALMVDYNESTPLPSPVDDEDIGRMLDRH